MKKFKKAMSILLSLFLITLFTSIIKPVYVNAETLAELSSKENLVDKIAGPGVSAENITYTGNAVQAAVFSGASFLPFSDGIVLSTGKAESVFGPASNDSAFRYGNPGDTNLTEIYKSGGYNGETHDAASLEFTITPTGNKLSFSYIFASEEYILDWNLDPVEFNDVFGLYINGKNIALLPETSTPVTVNSTRVSPYFIDNLDGTNLCFAGYTKELTCTADVTPNTPVKIKLVIADAGDDTEDSAVFIKADSINFPPILSSVTPSGMAGDDISAVSDKEGTLYLVPKGTYEDKAALEAAAGKMTAACAANSKTSINTSGLQPGTYQLYAADSLNLLSAPSKDIIIKPLDKAGPNFGVSGNPADWTNSDVTLKITASDEESGLNNDGAYSFDGGESWAKISEKTFSENQTVNIKVRDNLGNISSKDIIINKIDKIPPIITVNPYSTEKTDKSITVTASVNEGTLNAASHIFTENGSFNFEAYDAAGNKTVKTVTISNITNSNTNTTLPKTGSIIDLNFLLGIGILIMAAGAIWYKLSDKKRD